MLFNGVGARILQTREEEPNERKGIGEVEAIARRD